jgi:hypothetical protein
MNPSLRRVIVLLSRTIVTGAVGGAVIGGIGGRLAMRVLFITTGDAVKGVTSDDGFTIGRFTLGKTVGLIGVTTAIGIFAALLMLLALPFVRGRRMVPVMTVYYGVIGGALMVHRGGVDFTRLHPVMLAVVLFVAICAGFGAAAARMLDAAAGRDEEQPRWWLVGPPLAVLFFPPFLIVAVPAAVVNWAAGAAGRDHDGWNRLRLAAGTVMSALFVLGAVDLARDVAALV